ncbi:MAG: YdcF family protein [Propionibacteriaceae bacterium]|jgi:uncharacterized SAM-binding protein YcdF (DUF218 family)|nr:YdcF family protein [Propionibacteriaceae bacterium]
MWSLTIVWSAVFAFSVWRDPRKLRNGIYLLSALLCLGLGLGRQVSPELSQTNQRFWPYLILAGAVAIVLLALVLGVVLVLNGATMLRREGTRPANLLSLGLGLAILGYLTLSLLSLSDPTNRLLVWTILIGLPVGYLGFCFLAYVLYSGLYQGWTRRRNGPVDAVVVLGSGLVDGRVPPLLASRLDHGLSLWRRALEQGGRPALVVSGGRGRDEPRSEAAAMADYLVEHGVEPDLIWREEASRNTEQNIAHSQALLRARGVVGPVTLVTNNFHAFRAALLMRRAGLPGQVVGSPTAGYFWPSATIREFIAIFWDHKVLNAAMLGLSVLPLLVSSWVWARA